MKKNKSSILTVLGLLLVIFCLVFFAFTNENREVERYKIAVVVDEGTSNRWNVLKQGLDRAALDYNVEILFITASDSLYPNEQITLINRQLQNGVDGLILNPVSDKNMVSTVDNVAGQIPLYFMESTVSSENMYPCIGPDNYQMGVELGGKVCEELESGEKIGILLGNQSKESYAERYRGLMDSLNDENIEVSWKLEKSSIGTIEKIEQVYEDKAPGTIICLGNEEAEEAIDFAVESGTQVKIFAIGNTEKVVYYVDKGLIHTLIVPNEFNMGYLAVREIAKQLEYGEDGSSENIEYTVVNKENMYYTDIQKLLFPIVQ